MIAQENEQATLADETLGFMRLKQILALLPVSKSTWWDGVKNGRFPLPVRMPQGKITFWRKRDIMELLRKMDAGEEI